MILIAPVKPNEVKPYNTNCGEFIITANIFNWSDGDEKYKKTQVKT